ncbi:uncharacterized protein LOC119093314 isoform X2 [Pollicipes pollicipes]|uniref:uncharacterized protein LOC119093314 isoform X2 n=1 Tax=Pollicipes pollicipes TaxID=41117 RepID=UPI001884EFFD|nr:uncharacterized protein LOC119093314 isoform X2 [Pollicipes pollicipes]
MSAAARLLLLALSVSVRQGVIVTSLECNVIVTGPDQPWTPSQQLDWRPVAPSTQHQFPSPPPERGEVVFSVQSAAIGLTVHLHSDHLPGAYRIEADAGGWRVFRVFVGARQLLQAGPPSADSAVLADAWTSYLVSASDDGRLRLLRLHDNGTSSAWLDVFDPDPLPVDRAAIRTLEAPPALPGTPGSGVGLGDAWSFWKFDCSPFDHQREPLCHIWPSWSAVMPVQFHISSARISPVVNLNLHVQTSSTAELLLLETPERYYVVSLSATELRLSRAELGATVPRLVSRTCLAPASPSARRRFRLVWVSVLAGFISVGVDEPASLIRPCEEEVGRAERAESAAGQPPPTELTEAATEGGAGLEDATSESTRLEEATGAEATATEEEVEVTTLKNEAEEPTTSGPPPSTTTEGAAERATFLRWQDGRVYWVNKYGFRTVGGQGRWAVDCKPGADGRSTDEESGRHNFQSNTGIISFHALKPEGTLSESDEDPDIDTGSDVSDDREQGLASSQHFQLATVVLAVLSTVLLLVSATLASVVISQRRRRALELLGRRLSLGGADQFAALTDHGHQYAEVHLYEDLRPMSVRDGGSSFKPVRHETTPLFTRAPSPDQLPPPPDDM